MQDGILVMLHFKRPLQAGICVDWDIDANDPAATYGKNFVQLSRKTKTRSSFRHLHALGIPMQETKSVMHQFKHLLKSC